jgi:hypothetical protein
LRFYYKYLILCLAILVVFSTISLQIEAHLKMELFDHVVFFWGKCLRLLFCNFGQW